MWFAGNGVAPELAVAFGLSEAIGPITAAVQLGFIVGTLLFAVLKVSDWFSPSRVFLVCAVLGATVNLSIIWSAHASELLILRFATGFCLAGIYPVGMKIAADYHQKGLGLALGYLVGALVVGTAAPHLLRSLFVTRPWTHVIIATSALALVGGLLLVLTVPDGPFRRKSTGLDFTAFVRVFGHRRFRGAALGYFGHMWELYAFWAFLPAYIGLYNQMQASAVSVSLLSFSTIAAGGIGCVIGGYWSLRVESVRVASRALFTSMICIVVSPMALALPLWAFVLFLLVWGVAVIMDSPQFSSAAAAHAPAQWTGTALTIMNSLGFALTIGSISLLGGFQMHPYVFWWLLPGPLVGLLLMRGHLRN